VAEYLLDEQPQLVRRSALDTFNAELSVARDALARVEKRIERLEQKAEVRGASASGAAASARGTSK
jgi:ubiquinone biosynthesis accessory factor UbiJ